MIYDEMRAQLSGAERDRDDAIKERDTLREQLAVAQAKVAEQADYISFLENDDAAEYLALEKERDQLREQLAVVTRELLVSREMATHNLEVAQGFRRERDQLKAVVELIREAVGNIPAGADERDYRPAVYLIEAALNTKASAKEGVG